jgi:3'-5' exoribonuclease
MEVSMSLNLEKTSVGETFSGCFIVLQKEKKIAKNGRQFGDLLLGCKSGDIPAKIWDLSDDLFNSFDKESVVEITGKLDEFMGRAQIIINSLKTLNADDIDYEDFLPTSKYSFTELKEELLSIINSVEDIFLKRLLLAIFGEHDTSESDGILERFLKAPAAKNFHHAYIGGLAEHSMGVARLAGVIAENYPGMVNRSLLVAGALLHDIGKIQEFSFLRTIDYSTEGRLIGHHVLGYEMVKQTAGKLGYCENRYENQPVSNANGDNKVLADLQKETILQLLHLILSHHGSYENQSPKKPKTIEALLLHLCDDADAKISAFQLIEEASEKDSEWSPYNRILERFIYLKKLGETTDQT